MNTPTSLHRITVTTLITLAMLLTSTLALTATPSRAALGYVQVGTLNLSEAPGGKFSGLFAIGPNGEIWVARGSAGTAVFDEFNSAGKYERQITGSALPGLPGAMAIGPYGEMWVAEQAAIYEFSPTGALLRTLTGEDARGFRQIGGIAVDTTGALWVSAERSVGLDDRTTIEKFREGVYQGDVTGSSNCKAAGGGGAPTVAVDSRDNFVWGTCGLEAEEFNSEGVFQTQISGTPFGHLSADSRSVAVDARGDVLLGNVDDVLGVSTFDRFVDVFDAGSVYQSRVLIAENFSTIFGIAVNDSGGVTSGYMYVGVFPKRAASVEVRVFRPVVVPDISTDAAEGVSRTSMRLTGMVNPDGVGVSSCEFVYGTNVELGERKAHRIACASLPGSGSSPVEVDATIGGLGEGEEYEYYVVAKNSAGGENESVPVSQLTLPALPVVNDSPPVVLAVGQYEAEVRGTVDAGGGASSYHVVYGQSEAYGSSSPADPIGREHGDVSTGPVLLSGLQPGTTYHFALVADNASGTVTGPDYTFTTLPAPAPIPVTGGVSGVSETTATLSGSVDPQGEQSTVGFELGTSAGAYTLTLPAGSFASSVNGPQPFAVAVGGLLQNVTYHYRVFATGGGQTVYGADETFTTSTYTDPFTAQVAPPLLTVPQIVFPNVKELVSKTLVKHTKKKVRKRKILKKTKPAARKSKKTGLTIAKRVRGHA